MALSDTQVSQLRGEARSRSTSRRARPMEPIFTMSRGGMSSPRPTASSAMTPGTGEPLPADCVWSGTIRRLSRRSLHRQGPRQRPSRRYDHCAGGIRAAGKARPLPRGKLTSLALKAAETDATKRALATFGNPFGLALYDRELIGVRNRKALAPELPETWVLLSASGEPQQSLDTPKLFLAQLQGGDE